VPSIGYEVFGIVILEGFAQRTPAIVHDLGALPEVIEESGGGLVYRRRDDLVAAMEVMRTDPDRRHALGDAGHDALKRLWSEEPHVESYFAAIEEAADRTKLDRP
jgi:glycosyltransferase involved in cell wall biosynthesis